MNIYVPVFDSNLLLLEKMFLRFVTLKDAPMFFLFKNPTPSIRRTVSIHLLFLAPCTFCSSPPVRIGMGSESGGRRLDLWCKLWNKVDVEAKGVKSIRGGRLCKV